jgi:lysophospholipase L1-like esterase
MRVRLPSPPANVAISLSLSLTLFSCAHPEALEPLELDAAIGPSTSDTGPASAVPDASSDDIRAKEAGALEASVLDSSSPVDAGHGAQDGETPVRDAAPASPDASADAGPACARGAVKARQVVMIGDSFFHITEIPQVLWSNARAAGALGPDESYRHYYFSGAMVASPGTVAPIPTQWDDALAEDRDIRVVIFNGGGNDVLIGDRSCLMQAPPQNSGCAMTVENVRKTVRTLMDRMAKDGVEEVVYATYPHMPTWGLFQGDAPAINQTIDYAEEIARKECETSQAPRCVFVSTKAAFEGHPEYLNPLDVHASPEGSKVAGGLIWQAMVDHCIAQ